MPIRNGAHGYGAVTKVLHWLTALVVAAQFVVGLTMDTEDHAGRERFDAAKDACETPGDSDAAKDAEDRCEERVKQEEDAEQARTLIEAQRDPVARALLSRQEANKARK